MTGVRVKPDNNMVELSMSLPDDPHEQYNDPEKQQRWASSGTDGQELDHLKFSSTHIPPVCHYAICSFSGANREVLNMTPLKASYQMRPSYQNLDKEDEEKQEKLELAKGMAQQDSISNSNNSVEADSNGLSKVQLKKRESDRAMQARKNSYAYKRRMMEEEEWIELDIQQNKALSREGLDPMRDDDRQIAFDFKNSYMACLNYLGELKALKALEHGSSFTPDANSSADDVESAISMVISCFYSSSSPVNLYVLLAAVKYKSREDVLEALKVCGTLVRGNFVLKSKLTPYGPSARVVRNTILDILMDVGVVDRVRLKRAVQELDISNDLINHMLKEICKQDEGGWVLKVEDDSLFYADYGELANSMREEWKVSKEEIETYRQRYDLDTGGC